MDAARKLPNLARRLEQAFEDCRELWWRLGRDMSRAPSAELAHAFTGGAFGSDFGLMLAWARLTRQAAEAKERCLVLCDDPWLFRHLATLLGVAAGHPPALWTHRVRLRLRGFLARCKVSITAVQAALQTRKFRAHHAKGDSVLLVYGHPKSDAQGTDAYFGDLMKTLPSLKRLLHVDCNAARAKRLAADGRTASLHAWGHSLFALALPFLRWRPAPQHLRGSFGWLVRRAADQENGGGGPAMTRWQMHCQERWLEDVMPRRVAWPWENFAWERGLCRTARKRGVATIGYQHTVVGPHQINYSTATNSDGLASIPDLVVANGPAYKAELSAWGMPEDRLLIGGAFRFKRFRGNLFDPDGPVFVPLSAIPQAARQQVAAARAFAETGRAVLVKEHPMYPQDFKETPYLKRTQTSLADHKGLSAVLYCTGASGLEALLAGLPTFRLMLEDRIAIDILPAGVEATPVTRDGVVEAHNAAANPRPLHWESVLAPPDMELWRRLLLGEGRPPERRRPAMKEAS